MNFQQYVDVQIIQPQVIPRWIREIYCGAPSLWHTFMALIFWTPRIDPGCCNDRIKLVCINHHSMFFYPNLTCTLRLIIIFTVTPMIIASTMVSSIRVDTKWILRYSVRFYHRPHSHVPQIIFNWGNRSLGSFNPPKTPACSLSLQLSSNTLGLHGWSLLANTPSFNLMRTNFMK